MMNTCCTHLLLKSAGRLSSRKIAHAISRKALRNGLSPCSYVSVRLKSKGDKKNLSALIEPVHVPLVSNPDHINVGAEITGEPIKKEDMLKLLNQFYKRPELQNLAKESGLDHRLFHQAYIGFRRFCIESEALPPDIHIVLSDILQGAGHVDDLFPYFYNYAKEMFPHLECMEELKKISDLTLPANWYPEARGVQRKIIYHAGPTNSGKTYHALQRFLTAKSAVYCGPLRLLAAEVYKKSNEQGTPCDLVTGEERRYADPDGEPSSHVACTVEMTSVTTPYEVAVIDEVQMLKSKDRGWAWTRALLGVCAEEIHVCGDPSALDLLNDFMLHVGDEVEVRKYKRLTPLKYLDYAVEKFENIQAGDCIVCFSKNDIYHVSRQVERRNLECAVIYGGLPPGTKVAQAEKFNDPNHPCKILVATDAIGMGLNLNIRRIVFYSLIKPTLNEKGEKEMDVLDTSTALQISGRAGRYGTQYPNGEVTTFKREDLSLLRQIVNQEITPIEQAGLHPTAEQIELFAYHLPKATLSNLIDIFVTICELDNQYYFMCNVDDFKFLADMIEHVPLGLRTRYIFCCAPIPKKQPFVCTMFLKFARRYSSGEPLTVDWLARILSWPLTSPGTIADLVHLEGVFDVLDLYLWLSYRFMDHFPHAEQVREMQSELDEIIQNGVYNITRLLKASETKVSSGAPDDEDDFEIKKRQQVHSRNRLEDREVEVIPSHPQTLSGAYQRAKLSRKVPVKKGKLSDYLVQQGLISEKVLERLQREWLHEQNLDSNEDNGHLPGKRKPRKKR
ncbi:unnamed protein product [Owenia fusiformis]|uniref:RNA helicase n=1 Tax=Owenia fusiformis TaxID=6347 RepID=A0A8J1XGE5_OWEFU|nr:unnamed protein product [Owenia fusiformis]